MFKQLAALADSPQWAEQIDMVEKYLEGSLLPSLTDALLESAKQLLELARPAGPADDDPSMGRPAEQPRRGDAACQRAASGLGAVLGDAARGSPGVRHGEGRDLPAAETLVKTRRGLTDNERQRTHARRAIGLLDKLHPKELEEVKHVARMRIKAAQRYIELRSFLKLEALRLSWPGLTGYLSERGDARVGIVRAYGKVDEAVLGRLAGYRHDAG